MAWGEGEPEGNEGSSCLRALPPPRPFAFGRLTSPYRRTTDERLSSLMRPHSHQSAGKSRIQHPPVPSAPCAERFDYLRGGVRRAGWQLCSSLPAVSPDPAARALPAATHPPRTEPHLILKRC